MTYVEKMVEKIDEACGCDWPEEAKEVINEIIVDTKRASYEAVRKIYSLTAHVHGYKAAIDRAEVKEQEK